MCEECREVAKSLLLELFAPDMFTLARCVQGKGNHFHWNHKLSEEPEGSSLSPPFDDWDD